MRKGTKRKTTQKAEPKSKPVEDQEKNDPSQSPAEETNSDEPSRNAETEPEPEPSKVAAGKGRRKRAKVATPEAVTEYFPEKRNLEDLRLQVFPVCTECDQLDLVYDYEYKWNFSNFEEALEEGGELHNKKVYIFGCTEPQLVPYKDHQKLQCYLL